MDHNELSGLKHELSVKAKNGIDFIVSASLVWILITIIWSLPFDSYSKSVLTFMVGALMLPLALLMLRLIKTQRKIANYPLQPLGLWLSFAQLFFIPFLIFMQIKMPSHCIMTYAIITGAYLFPYAWFYNEISYAVGVVVISVGSLILGSALDTSKLYFSPLVAALSWVLLAIVLAGSCRKKVKAANYLVAQHLCNYENCTSTA
jgi:hypothetical protein